MKFNFFYDSSSAVKLVFSLLIIVAAFCFCFIGGMLLAIPIFHLSINDQLQILMISQDVSHVHYLKYFQITQSIGFFLIPPLFLAWLFSPKPYDFLKISRFPSMHIILPVILLMWIALPFINYTAELNGQMQLPSFLYNMEQKMRNMEEAAKRLTELFIMTPNYGELMLNLFMIAVLPAIGEELLFRGFFQGVFTEMTSNKHFGNIISAFLFSFIHLQFYGFIPRFLLGLLLGYLLIKSGSLWLPIIAHFVNNATAVVFYYILTLNNGKLSIDLDTIGSTKETMIFAILSAMLSFGIIWLINKRNPSIDI